MKFVEIHGLSVRANNSLVGFYPLQNSLIFTAWQNEQDYKKKETIK